MWPQLLTLLLGVWLTASPAALGYGGPAAANDHVVGPLVAMTGLVAAFEVTRPVRWAAAPLGAWLVVAPWVLGHPPAALLNDTLTGVAVAVLSGVRGKTEEQFGGGWPALWRGPAGTA